MKRHRRVNFAVLKNIVVAIDSISDAAETQRQSSEYPTLFPYGKQAFDDGVTATRRQLQTPNDVRGDGSFLQLLPSSLAPGGDGCCSVSTPQRRAHFNTYATCGKRLRHKARVQVLTL